MFFNQLKSLYRNKANKIYIIMLFILFLIFNISLKISTIAYNYYNEKIESDYIDLARNITINDVIELSEEDILEIKKKKHIENIYSEILEIPSGNIKTYHIWVDDWSNVNSVIKYFDKIGIRCTRSFGGPEYDKLFNSYENAQIILKTTISVVLIINVVLFISCWKNMFRNEEKNINILKIIGYRKSIIERTKIVICVSISLIIYLLTNVVVKNIISIFL